MPFCLFWWKNISIYIYEYKRCKSFEPHKFVLYLIDNINSKRSDKYFASPVLGIYYMKKHQKVEKAINSKYLLQHQ